MSSSNRRQFLTGRAAADALASALGGEPGGEGDPTAPPPAPYSPVDQETHLVRVGRQAMACQWEVLVNAARQRRATPAIIAALDVIDALEEQLSVFREASEVSQLNRTAADSPVVIEAGLCELLEMSLRIWRETRGAFDITAGPLSRVWGFYRRAGQIPHPDDLVRALEVVGSQHLQLDPDRRTIAFDRPGVELNLGAIGKGYALDRAAAHLTAAGVHEFLFHGGRSSMLARGELSAGEPWTVGIGDPNRPGKRLCEIVLRDRGLSTSGSGTQFFRHAGERYGHILDPRTGQPVAGMLSVSVTAPTAAEADALSTAFYVLGIDAALEYCSAHPEIGAILVGMGTPVRVEIANIPEEEIVRGERAESAP